MSYLSQPTSKTEYGVVKVGDYIGVIDGVISLEQDLSPNANVAFGSGSFGNLTAGGNPVITEVTPSAGNGITIANLVSGGYSASFTVINTGVLSLTAGPGIAISANTGNVTISAQGADLIHVYGTTVSYTATADDEYIGVNSANAVVISLPSVADEGRVYIVKDEYGQGSGKITIQPPAGTLIDKKTNYIISIPNQSVQIVYRAGGWWII